MDSFDLLLSPTALQSPHRHTSHQFFHPRLVADMLFYVRTPSPPGKQERRRTAHQEHAVQPSRERRSGLPVSIKPLRGRVKGKTYHAFNFGLCKLRLVLVHEVVRVSGPPELAGRHWALRGGGISLIFLFVAALGLGAFVSP